MKTISIIVSILLLSLPRLSVYASSSSSDNVNDIPTLLLSTRKEAKILTPTTPYESAVRATAKYDKKNKQLLQKYENTPEDLLELNKLKTIMLTQLQQLPPEEQI